MGRPINNIYIDSTNSSGGEGVASLAVHGGNSYSAGTTISFAASPIGGTTPTASIAYVIPAVNSQPGNGNVSSVTLTTAGSGYLVRNLVATFTKPANVVVDGVTGFYGLGAAGTVVKFSTNVTSGIYAGMVANVFFTTLAFGEPTKVVSVDTASGNITFSTANTAAISSPISFGDVGRLGNVVATMATAVTTGNTIQGNAWVTVGAQAKVADINRQKSTKKYRVTNADGTDVVLLDASAATIANGGPANIGTMTITATDSSSGTYHIKKLFDRTAVVYPGSGTQFTENQKVSWNMNAAVASTSIKIATND
jgi:hypothetical protein